MFAMASLSAVVAGRIEMVRFEEKDEDAREGEGEDDIVSERTSDTFKRFQTAARAHKSPGKQEIQLGWICARHNRRKVATAIHWRTAWSL